MADAPPFAITNKALSLVADISEMVGRATALSLFPDVPHLRKQNRIRAIHSSLAIENNTLTLDQVTDVIDGKRVLGRPEEIREVKNAYEAYEAIMEYNALSINDLKRAHKLMMQDLVKEAGTFRTGGVGVYGEQGLVHLAPPAHLVPTLVHNLFAWYAESDTHILVKSAVFHYEFEFIHPFADGNGRIGRLWHSRLLAEWNPIFYWIPVEEIIRARQQEYYQAFSASAGSSTPFIEFMLELIRDAVAHYGQSQRRCDSEVRDKIRDNVRDKLGETATKIAEALLCNPTGTLDDLAAQLSLSRRAIEKNVKALREAGMLRREGSNKRGRWIIL